MKAARAGNRPIITRMKKSFASQRKVGSLSWRLVRGALTAQLSVDDDAAFWEYAVSAILGRTMTDVQHCRGKDAILVEIGLCSHWIQPGWKMASGMTWPFGYDPTVFHWGSAGFAYRSLPAFDWSLVWRLDPDSGALEPVRGQPTRRPVRHRICMPARTSYHPQATVHTIWTPGSPENPARKRTILYGFERTPRKWRCFATWDDEPAAKARIG
jgi:hypothetical protein